MPYNYRPEKPPQKSFVQVVRRVNYLRALNEPYMGQRQRIRALMNGGRAALNVLLKDLPTNEDTLPAANLIKSGVERFSEMIAFPPDLKIDPPGGSDKDRAQRGAEKRERIVNYYDEQCNLEGQLEQGSLWLPGYGFFAWKIREAVDRNGYRYPKAELRDPYTTWPAEWGVDQQPDDIAFQRFVEPETLVSIYPHARAALAARATSASKRLGGGAVDLSRFTPGNNSTPGWEGNVGGIEVIEYVDAWGTYVYSTEVDGFLDVYEHPLSRAPISVPKRTTFDTLHGQFDDVVGLASTMAKLTLLTQIIMEDAAFAPVVVNGRMDGPFEKGRDSVNYIEGGDAKYLYQNIPYQMFSEIDRIEGHLRASTGYSKQADGESPISFVTGQGLEELGSSLSRQSERAQSQLRRALEAKDSIQLEWDELAYGDEAKSIQGTRKGAMYAEEYTPSKDIGGHYSTRRIYGLMAGMDEARKTVGLLQLLAGGVIDVGTVQENLRGIDNAPKVRDRIISKRAEDTMFEALTQMAAQGDPTMVKALSDIRKNPHRLPEILDEVFAPQEPEAPPMAAPASPEDEWAQVLTRLTGAGEVQGGAQTVQRLGA